MNERYGAPVSGDEKQVLGGFLDHYRATLLDICEGLSDECAKFRVILENASLDDLSEDPGRSADYNVRWIVVHMIEETARHAGHADIIRELIDGKTETGYV